jgi:hypothetical protein
MHPQKVNPRVEYRQQENQRINDSRSLAEEFRELKSLTAHVTHFAPEGLRQMSEMKCTFNLAHAKSMFRVDCPNPECVGGDFDLSAALANAVAARSTTASGEACCPGWRSRTTIGQVRCNNILRYTLSVGY